MNIDHTFNPLQNQREKIILHKNIVESIKEIGERIRVEMIKPDVDEEVNELPLDISKCDV